MCTARSGNSLVWGEGPEAPSSGQGLVMGAVAVRRRPTSALLSLLENTPVTGVGGMGVSCPALSPNLHPTQLGGLSRDRMIRGSFRGGEGGRGGPSPPLIKYRPLGVKVNL